MDPAIGYAFALIFVLIGLVGMVLPALPGVPLVFAGLLLAVHRSARRYANPPPRANRGSFSSPDAAA